MAIGIPEIIEHRLATERNLRAAVDGTIADFDAWLDDSKLPFFTDYTDHGAKHLSQVLTTAIGLMTPCAKDLFTTGDAAVLVLAVLLHDSAMHLSESGFYELIKGKAADWKIPEFDKITWPDLWDEFLFSARRWDDQKLVQVFGSHRPGEQEITVRDPFENYTNLAAHDRKLIGEFIRTYHSRMAHEFAVFGVPAPHAKMIRVSDRLNSDLCDIVGLVARSHGLPVRACIDVLISKYHKREYKGVHAAFLMCLLRVSDYLQVQPERANSIAFRYRHIASPVSQQEWKTHNAVVNITQTGDDPESIEIQARPEDVRTYLRLREWLAGIQSELDASWAVLGEVYGSHTQLRQLGLVLRRVRSNLEDTERFAEKVDYVPRKIEFDVARAQLLKLLIRPLYGSDPSIGVRELIQNAVDAVRELAVLKARHKELTAAPLLDQEADVEVWLEDVDSSGKAWITISDRGVGMTEEVLRDFFLKAGASFRYSDAWKRDFEDDGDSSRPFKSRVLRSGRFGVGALAAFLLGNEIFVSTRHVTAKSGIRFATKLDSEPIELRHDNSLRVGTTIRIQVSASVHNELLKENYTTKIPGQFDWYVLGEPTVRRLYGANKQPLDRKFFCRLPPPGKSSSWRKLPDVHDYDVFWSYVDAPALTCNGIFVSNSTTLKRFNNVVSQGSYYALVHPKICILDPDGNLPLTLRRDSISEGSYRFEHELRVAIVRDFLASLLVRTPEQGTVEAWRGMPYHSALDPEGVRSSYGQTFYTPRGISIIDPRTIAATQLQNCAYIVETDFYKILSPHDAVFYLGHSMDWSFIASLVDGLSDASTGFTSQKPIGVRALVRKKVIESQLNSYFVSVNGRRLPEKEMQAFKENLTIDDKEGGWAVVATKGCPETRFSYADLERRRTPDFAWAEVFYSDTISARDDRDFVSDWWLEIIRNPIIPFDLKMRREQLAHAYAELSYYVERYSS